MPHDIRLAGPWERSTDNQTWEKCVLPHQCSVSTESLKRPFHRPSGLDESSTVYIVIETTGSIEIFLNDLPTETMIAEAQVSAEVTSLLKPFNTLQLSLSPEKSELLIASVKLRIFEADEVVAHGQDRK